MSSYSRKVKRRQKRPDAKARIMMSTRFQRPWREVADTIRDKKAMQRYSRQHPIRTRLLLIAARSVLWLEFLGRVTWLPFTFIKGLARKR